MAVLISVKVERCEKNLKIDKEEVCAVIKYMLKKGMREKVIYKVNVQIPTEDSPSTATLRNWVAEFKHSRDDTEDDTR